MSPTAREAGLSRSLGLSSGAGRRTGAGQVPIGDAATSAASATRWSPSLVPVRLEVSRLSGPGLRAAPGLRGRRARPCMRCLKDAGDAVEVDAREVETGAAEGPRGDEEDSRAPTWRTRCSTCGLGAGRARARPAGEDPLPRGLPGLCPVCAADLSEVGEDHHHDASPTRAGRSCASSGSTEPFASLPPMAVPKRKQSHSRTAKRRAQHKIDAALAERLPALREPAARAPGLPGVRHLRRPRGAPAGGHEHEHGE